MRRMWVVIGGGLASLALQTVAWSAGVFCGQPKTFDNLPATNHYVIVQPTPIERVPCAQPNRPCTWPITHHAADPYPYGWFGARPKAQPARTGSYYGNYRDFQWNRTP